MTAPAMACGRAAGINMHATGSADITINIAVHVTQVSEQSQSDNATTYVYNNMRQEVRPETSSQQQMPIAPTRSRTTQHHQEPRGNDCPPLSIPTTNRTRFYTVWRVYSNPALEGIWVGEDTTAWYTLIHQLPNRKYNYSTVRLRRWDTWEEAWNAWWTEGPMPRPTIRPQVHVA